MTIHFISGGGKHAKEYVDLIASYEERVMRYFPLEVTLVQSKGATPKSIREEESGKILRHMEKCDWYILFDERGKEMSSEDLSSALDREIDAGKKHIGVVVGGAYGVDDRVREQAGLVVSFSPMVFPHQLARTMAMEQTYRALDIRAGGRYHHK